MLQSDPPPRAVKVTMSKRIPLVGEELAAYEEEQNRKREEALKATLVKEEESRASLGAELSAGDPMAVNAKITQPSSNGVLRLNYTLPNYTYLLHSRYYLWKRLQLYSVSLED